MTKLKFINLFFIQWFFIRIARNIDQRKGYYFQWFTVIGPIVPLTGWINRYWGRSKKLFRIGATQAINGIYK